MFKKIKSNIKTIGKEEFIFILILILINIVLLSIPNDFEKVSTNSYSTKAVVLDVDNSNLEQHGIIKTGTQQVKVKLLEGENKGLEIWGPNYLKGQLELDKMFTVGENALVVVDKDGSEVNFINLIDHYRLNIEILLFDLFIGALIIFGGWIGFKSILSFITTVTMIWRILIPMFLKGYNPILVAMLVVTTITAITIYLVGGFNKKSTVAYLGSISGILITCALAIIFGRFFKIHGAVIPFSESLLYSGYSYLDLSSIFLSGIFIASSGAIMDITMDIAAAQQEIVETNPSIDRKELIIRGMNIAKAVIGTMTTTLLLAYSGGFTGMLMVFMAQGTPVVNILNFTYVSSEVMHTLVGSFGLILVAPFTAVLGGFILVVSKDHCSLISKKPINEIKEEF